MRVTTLSSRCHPERAGRGAHIGWHASCQCVSSPCIRGARTSCLESPGSRTFGWGRFRRLMRTGFEKAAASAVRDCQASPHSVAARYEFRVRHQFHTSMTPGKSQEWKQPRLPWCGKDEGRASPVPMQPTGRHSAREGHPAIAVSGRHRGIASTCSAALGLLSFPNSSTATTE